MALRLLVVLSLLAAACRPEIGDPCETSTDCSPTGERLCDITQKDGYCTIFNCEPNECPEEAVCVRFGDQRSPVEGCDDPLAQGPYARTFCMKACGENNDCRENDGYKCVDPNKAWNARVLDPFSKVCGIQPLSNPAPVLNEDGGTDMPRSNDVCTGDVTPDAGGAGAGAGGAGG